jgi:Yip1 domain
MGAVFQRFIETIRFDREAFVWMDFNDRATGDALILVVITQVLFMIAGGTPLLGFVTGIGDVVAALVSTAIFWLVYSAIVYAVVRYLFRGEGTYAFYLRVAGFAFPTLLLLLFTTRFIELDPLAAVLGSLWFLAIVAYGTHYIADLPLTKAGAAAVSGYVGWVVIQSILSGLRFI